MHRQQEEIVHFSEIKGLSELIHISDVDWCSYYVVSGGDGTYKFQIVGYLQVEVEEHHSSIESLYERVEPYVDMYSPAELSALLDERARVEHIEYDKVYRHTIGGWKLTHQWPEIGSDYEMIYKGKCEKLRWMPEIAEVLGVMQEPERLPAGRAYPFYVHKRLTATTDQVLEWAEHRNVETRAKNYELGTFSTRDLAWSPGDTICELVDINRGGALYAGDGIWWTSPNI